MRLDYCGQQAWRIDIPHVSGGRQCQRQRRPGCDGTADLDFNGNSLIWSANCVAIRPVEYFDPHDVYKLLAPGLVPRLPLHNLNWQSHSGPLRSIDTLHVELIKGDIDAPLPESTLSPKSRRSGSVSRDSGLRSRSVSVSTDSGRAPPSLRSKASGNLRRHQIPGLRRTPYLKLLLVRCDDNDSYKNSVRAEVREWVKNYTSPVSHTSKKSSGQENHDAFEWLIVHVVIPNTAASTQPRSSGKSDAAEKTTTSRWRTGTTPLLEKLRSDFNATAKGSQDRVSQIRIGINDVPYNLLPRVVPAVPSGYNETEQDAENAWNDLIAKFKSLILASFDMRVTQYEEDIREKDAQRTLPGWNFCTFFILKEGLARGFESVGLVEDALVGYDELNVGLDTVIHEQLETGSPQKHGGEMLAFTEDLRDIAEKALETAAGDSSDDDGDTDSNPAGEAKEPRFDEIAISSTTKAYRDMILANKVSIFDFRCYIFSRQIALLLRLGNALSSKEELLAMLKDQQEDILYGEAPLAPPPPHQKDEPENLITFAEICQRTLQFIPSVSQILRRDVIVGLTASKTPSRKAPKLDPRVEETVDNMVASFAFSVAQQILAQTSTKALPIPPSSLSYGDGLEPKSSIPEPKTMIHPARNSSLSPRGSVIPAPPLSPGFFPGPGRQFPAMGDAAGANSFLKNGLEDLAARRAELYMLSRSILSSLGKKRSWSDGWDEAPLIRGVGIDDMEDVNLDEDDKDNESDASSSPKKEYSPLMAGIDNAVLRTAIDNKDDFYRLFEILTDKAMRHFTVANHDHAVHSSMADLAVLKVHLKDYKAASSYFSITTPFFGKSGWSLLELSMLIMYCQCLDEMNPKGEHVGVALKLLTKYCAAEKERLQKKSGFIRFSQDKSYPDAWPVTGIVEKLTKLVKSLSNEVKIPLENFFTDVEICGVPEYEENQDGCSLHVGIRSLLPEEISFDTANLRISSVDEGPSRERIFDAAAGSIITLTPGKNKIRLDCKNLVLHFERDANASVSGTTDLLKHPDVMLFQRNGTFDVVMSAAKQTSLDRNNSLELAIHTGWNSIKACEIRVKPATGGLRFLTTEAAFVGDPMEFAKPPEAGVFCFDAIAANTVVTLRFPYSVEQDVADVLAKIEATYVTEADDTFHLAKSLAIPVSLALGVNVQDVFKHQALFSRFNVSTASAGPLRLYKSELLDSDLFDSTFGVPPTKPVFVFPKQPASLLYKIKRKPGAKASKKGGRTMYLKLDYTLLETEMEELIRHSLSEALETTPLTQYSKFVVATTWREFKGKMLPRDLEQATLMGELSTTTLKDVVWEKHFTGIGGAPGVGEHAAEQLSTFLRTWQKANGHLAIPAGGTVDPSSILIPVEIPALPVLHTADIRLQSLTPSPIVDSTSGEGLPTVCTNQMLPATLHLKWTRIWDTDSSVRSDQEFSYEVTAPMDTWLLGGRRKGHFVIPGPSASSPAETMTSTPETEAEIPLILIPLREGWLPYPLVEIREVVNTEGDGGQATAQGCEVDLRNLGETVRVVGDRSGMTVSLDASGPGGGPLVFESERLAGFKGKIVE
ncbi:cis-golgi transport particle complex subunit [Trichoderma arundinaceum]|uniref:Cis-golgi transport particle complex subunit n=1 Tax=Trichoderma arundinaceum TaxID=490622 RepID=A0A395NKJ6_TRIAR|nr:cis-golgi transport particle complex subunit [Trichoderma arundinaceum]